MTFNPNAIDCHECGTLSHIINKDDYVGATANELSELPPARPKPCGECPWRKESAPGWLGPWTAEEWLELAHSDEPVACHTSIETNDTWTPHTRQCAGAASYRKTMGKQPRNPEVAVGPVCDNVLIGPMSFLQHHKNGA